MSVVQQQNNSYQRPIKPKQGEGRVDVSSNTSFPPVQMPEIAFDQSITQESLDRLLDLDSILQEDLKQNVSPIPMLASPNNAATATSNTAQLGCNTVSKDTLSIPATTGLQSRKRKLSNINTDLNIKYVVSPRNQRLESEEIMGLEGFSPFGDSSYGSDLSDAASPKSDASSLLGDDGWEESFTELFPISGIILYYEKILQCT